MPTVPPPNRLLSKGGGTVAMTRKWCEDCGRHVKAEKQDVNHVLHLLMTLLTCGLWVVVWGLVILADVTGGWRCHQCGRGV